MSVFIFTRALQMSM